MALEEKQVLDAIAHGAEAKRITAPSFFATNFVASASSYAVSLIFQRNAPATIEIGNETAQIGVVEPVVVLDVPIGTIKDMVEVLTDILQKHEAAFGEISTEFLRRRGK